MNYEDQINIRTSVSQNYSSFLIDTQADISVIKLTSIENTSNIDSSNTINIKGITSDTISSLGTTTIELFIENKPISHEVHVVPAEFNIDADGILGKDFLNTFHCAINFQDQTLTINFDKEPTILNLNQSHSNIHVPPRSESIRQFQINFNKPCVIDNQEIAPGVFVPRTIINPSEAYIRILNTTEKAQKIPNNTLRFEPLDNFVIYNIDKVNPDKDRIEKLNKIFSNKIPTAFRENLIPLIHEFSDIFALPTDKMTTVNFYEQNLKLSDSNPVYIKNYRTPYTHKTEINNQINKLLDSDLIEPCSSNYNSPLILVPKKSTDGNPKWRMCVDYRAINKKLAADTYPLSRIDDVLDGLGKAQHFTVLDLYNGFHQVPLTPESRDITAFSSDQGSFRWKVLPFGLNISPNSFSRMMALAFSGLPPEKLFIYMDDLIVIGRSEKNHLNNLRDAFTVCRNKNLKINPEKCQFFRPEVLFLGHICSNQGIKPDPTKFSCIKNYPVPHDADAVRRFVALANFYRKFVPNFALLSIPLNALTRKNTVFKWSTKCQDSFEKLKTALISPNILAYPDYSSQFVLTVDASKLGCGAVLSQGDRPIAFASKAFSKAESNKATIEQELLAIHWSIKHFKHYLIGVEFQVQSDHKPLIYLYNLKDPTSKLTRLRLELAEFNFTINHIPGKDNVVADALSRIHIRDIIKASEDAASILALTRSMTNKQQIASNITKSKNDKPQVNPRIYEASTSFIRKKVPLITSQRISQNKYNIQLRKSKTILVQLQANHSDNATVFIKEILAKLDQIAFRHPFNLLRIQTNDPIFKLCAKETIKQIGNQTLKHVSIILVDPPKFVHDIQERKDLILLNHDNHAFGGHSGKRRLHAKLRQKYFWPRMTRDIAQHVNACHECQVNKVRKHTKIPMGITDSPSKPFETLSIDTIGPLPRTEKQSVYAVTAICNLTKYLICIPVENKEAETIAKAIVENIFLIHGPCSTILTDLGTEYCNRIFSEVLKLLEITHTNSTAYHPQTLGGIERSHRTLNEYLRSYLPTNKHEWDEYIKYFTYCYNTTPSSTFDCKFSPFELLFGRQPNIPDILNSTKIDPLYNFNDYVNELKYKIQFSNKIAREMLDKSKHNNKKIYDEKLNHTNFKINDIVLAIGNNHKLQPVYDGPFIILEIDNFNVKIKNLKNNKTKVLHKNKIIKYVRN